MDRTALEKFILEVYNADASFPWIKFPNYEVFRHPNNQKWFAAILDVPREKLGLPGAGSLDIVNLKCEPALVGSLRAEPGFFPAYHMNKENWISAALDESVSDDKIKMLLDLSFELTALNVQKRKKKE